MAWEAGRRLVGVVRLPGETSDLFAWSRALSPLIAPLTICACAARWELFAVALAWVVFSIPGLLLVNCLFPPDHPFGRGWARISVAALFALLPFALVSWPACFLHLSLTTALAVYSVIALAIVVVCGRQLLRQPRATSDTAPGTDPLPGGPRWAAVLVLVGGVVLLAGIAMSAPPPADAKPAARFLVENRPNWWVGAVVGGVGGLLAAAGLVIQTRSGLARGGSAADDASSADAAGAKTRSAPGERRGRPGKGPRKRAAAGPRAASAGWPLASGVSGLLWIVVAGLTYYVMLVTFTVAVPAVSTDHMADQIKRGSMLPWNVDDVAYASAAVDYRYGQPLGAYEPSIGSTAAADRSGISPLWAPLVATIARATGVGCAALHHAVMPPLVILLGVSALAGLFGLLFDGHRWWVPLGLLIALMLVLKTWDYARCMVEMIAFRAMQPKAVHLWLLMPLQLASLLLICRQPSRRHLLFAVAAGIVAHTTHPFGAIVGVVWTATFVLIALCWNRSALRYLVIVLATYGLCGGAFYGWTHQKRVGPRVSSGRVAGSRIQSRDMVRVEGYKFSHDASVADLLGSGAYTSQLRQVFADHDQPSPKAATITALGARGWELRSGPWHFRAALNPDDASKLDFFDGAAVPITRHDPFWQFGCNSLYTGGVMALPLLLAAGWWRRTWAWVGIVGLVVVVANNVTPLGKLINLALPEAILWRARWMVPAFVILPIVGVILWIALAVVLGKRGRVGTGLSAGLSVIVAAGFAVTLAMSDSVLLRTGATPALPGQPGRQLTKFSTDIHDLVDLLGGVQATPFVMGGFLVQHELPQLMPNIQLVYSREKFMRVVESEPELRPLATTVYKQLRDHDLDVRLFSRLLRACPIDHVVLTRRRAPESPRFQPARTVLQEQGWTMIGTAGIYEVWRASASPAEQ